MDRLFIATDGHWYAWPPDTPAGRAPLALPHNRRHVVAMPDGSLRVQRDASEGHTLSPEYRDVLRQAHAEDEHWGTSAHRRRSEVLELVHELHATSVIDYGCGKGVLVDSLAQFGQFTIAGYDPAVPRFEARPEPASMLVCLDVLEHVEPDHLDAVLADIHRLAPVAYLVIALVPARKVLPDGRNAHLIVRPGAWWMARLQQVFGHVTIRQWTPQWLAVLVHREAQA